MSVFASRPFVFSALLHASAAGVLLVMMLRMQRDPAPVPFIVDWGTPAPVAPDTRTATPSVSPAVNFTPVRVVAPVRIPAAEEVVTETPDRPGAFVRPTAAAQPATARTTITEHRRRNPASATAATTAASARSSPTAHINMGEVLAEPVPERAQPAVATAPAQSAEYWDRLLGKLRAAHEKPAGLDDGLAVRVEFLLRADGTVGDVRILASSGSAEFDASVVAAFRRLGGLGPPPANRAGLNQVTFRTRAE